MSVAVAAALTRTEVHSGGETVATVDLGAHGSLVDTSHTERSRSRRAELEVEAAAAHELGVGYRLGVTSVCHTVACCHKISWRASCWLATNCMTKPMMGGWKKKGGDGDEGGDDEPNRICKWTNSEKNKVEPADGEDADGCGTDVHGVGAESLAARKKCCGKFSKDAHAKTSCEAVEGCSWQPKAKWYKTGKCKPSAS